MVNILVIEDEAQIRQDILDWLFFEGYAARGAENGRVGLDAALQDPPDLIICDIAMPEMDGYNVLIEVRSTPLLVNTPFIFTTAAASREDMRQGMSLGADDYLTKPFSRAELLTSIEAQLAKKAALQEQMRHQLNALEISLAGEREQSQLKTRLVAMFSHDFINPLNAIMTSADILQTFEEKLTPERKRAHLTRITDSVRVLTQMLDDMMLVAKAESGQLDLASERLDVVGPITAFVEEFQLVHSETHTLTLHAPARLFLNINPKLLRQIVANLISNAVKYSPSGSDVVIRLEETPETVDLSVQDSGIGIPETALKTLFEPFHRASNAGYTKGMGLGLAIVKYAVDHYGGRIEIQSAVGQGTTVIVHLPRKQPTG